MMITHEQFVALIFELHPVEKSRYVHVPPGGSSMTLMRRAKRALKDIEIIPGKEMDYHQFRDICYKYPALPFPMEHMQHQLRMKVRSPTPIPL